MSIATPIGAHRVFGVLADARCGVATSPGLLLPALTPDHFFCARQNEVTPR
jgi:hypothetical protein